MTKAQPRRTVLIAEDTPFVRNRFKAAIENHGHRAITVDSGPEFLDYLRKNKARVHLILLNLKFGGEAEGQHGLDLVRGLRKLDSGRLPVLVFSGTIASSDEVRDLAALGIAGYVNEYSAVQHIIPALLPHLVSEESNRRKSPRVVVGMPIACRVGRTVTAALTLTIGRGGLSIATSKPLERLSLLRLRFRLPGAEKEIDADAVVRWANPGVGMGVQFERVDADDQTTIDAFVDSHFFKPRVKVTG